MFRRAFNCLRNVINCVALFDHDVVMSRQCDSSLKSIEALNLIGPHTRFKPAHFRVIANIDGLGVKTHRPDDLRSIGDNWWSACDVAGDSETIGFAD